MTTITAIANARLPRWLLGDAWPMLAGQPALASIVLAGGRVASVAPTGAVTAEEAWDVQGAPVLPGFVDAHTHLDKTFTLPRMRHVQPGLMGAIDAMMTDRLGWTAADVHQRASRALAWAHEAGTVHMAA
ncbi:MAG: amidohydrolase, partial [Haliea sp.]